MRFFNFFVCLGVLCGGVVGCGHVAWFSSKANLRRNQRRILAQQDIRDTGSSCRNDESICKTRAEVNPFVLGYCNTESGHCECANNALYEPSQDDCFERPECKGLFVAPAFEFRDNKMFCTCLPGFHLEGNQCVGNPCNASGAKTCPAQISECIYVPPDDYRCKCFAGYKETADRRSCEDIDECKDGTAHCDGAVSTCKNEPGGYRCDCYPGYEHPLGSKTRCVDKDECGGNSIRCDAKTSTCQNEPGGYRCDCTPGYKHLPGSTKQCFDVDECRDKTASCDPATSTCVNDVGGYHCECHPGHRHPQGSTTECVDNDECADGTAHCNPATSTCVNDPGGYRCECKPGYQHSPGSRTECIDVDECTLATPPCNATTSTCKNTIGSYECPCRQGYKPVTLQACTEDKNLCDDPYLNICAFIAKNEASQNITPISVLGKDGCIRGENDKYRCLCSKGFEEVNGVCVDIDECSKNIHKCDKDSTRCVNTRGAYDCVCLEGFKPAQINETEKGATVTKIDPHHCKDINECTEGVDAKPDRIPCNPISGLCRNTFGGYDCDCFKGYANVATADAKRKGCIADSCCADIDECATKQHQCSDICVEGIVEPPLNYTCGCVKKDYYLATPRQCVQCQFEQFGPFGRCDIACGDGRKNRTREVKPPGNATAECRRPENTIEFQACRGNQCEPCLLTAWSEWSPCNVTQGSGYRFQYRKLKRKSAQCNGLDLVRNQTCTAKEMEITSFLTLNWGQITGAGAALVVVIVGVGVCVRRVYLRRRASEHL